MSIWFMFDNHTFQRLSSDRVEAAKQALDCFDKPNGDYGLVGGKGKDEHVPMIHAKGDKKEFREDLEDWCGEKLDKHEMRLRKVNGV